MGITNKNKQTGFTIVELLIVIVVIGILAAITIVAYNGIQNRAKLATYQSDTVGLVKKSEAFNSVTGAYALTTTPVTPDTGATVCQSANGLAVASSLNGQSESKLNTGVNICGVIAGTVGTGPTYAQATTAATNAASDYYFVQYCTGGKGMYIYYPDPTTGLVSKVNSGVCP